MCDSCLIESVKKSMLSRRALFTGAAATTAAQHGELMAVIAMASQTNALATALQVPVDARFLAEEGTA